MLGSAAEPTWREPAKLPERMPMPGRRLGDLGLRRAARQRFQRLVIAALGAAKLVDASDWGIEEKSRALTRFVQQLTELRERYPILRRRRFLTGEYDEELAVKYVSLDHYRRH